MSTTVVAPVVPAPTGKTPLSPVSRLSAYSASDTSVGLTWKPSASENISDFNDYFISARTSAGTLVSSTTAARGDTGTIVNGLTEGVVYTFRVTAMTISDSSSYVNSVSSVIRWSPARRLDTLQSGQPINLYETSDSNGIHSGLVFFDLISQMPKVVSINKPGADSLSIDIYLHTETAHRVSLKSASFLHSWWRLTKFSKNPPRLSNSLDDPRNIIPDSISYTYTSITIDSSAKSSSAIYYFKGAYGNYGRILLKQDPISGSLIWGRSPAQFLNVEISYQTVPYNHFSKTVLSNRFFEGQ